MNFFFEKVNAKKYDSIVFSALLAESKRQSYHYKERSEKASMSR